MTSAKAGRLLRWTLPLVIALMTCFAYEQGVSGSLFYDDHSNLAKLATLETPAQAKAFVLDGASGPLGRSLALASFLPHAEGWPDSSLNARRINVLIHLCNAALLWALGFALLQLLRPGSSQPVFFISLTAAALWLVMPLLASTSLITVQRMTSLAAFFGLLGLLAYVHAYSLLDKRPTLALLLQFGGLGLGTLLAMLCKENGVLIPVFALAIEALLASRNPSTAAFRRLRLSLLGLALLSILGYLLSRLPSALYAETHRGFSVVERLLTESVILWQYLFLAFFPRLKEFGPFHDDYAIITELGLPLIAIGAFIALTWLAWRHRQRNPWPLFALLWFFTGHLIESSIIMLELYFEHRNYLAIYGFCLLLCYGAFATPLIYRKQAVAGLAVYGLLLWGILLLLAKTWGNPMVAAEKWFNDRPNSQRAAMTLSTMYYRELGNSSLSRKVLDENTKNCPNCIGIRLQALLYACDNEPPESVRNRTEQLIYSALNGKLSSTTLEGFYPLRELVLAANCQPVDLRDIQRLLQALQQNPIYMATKRRQQHLYYSSALIAYDMGELKQADSNLTRAESFGDLLIVLKLRLALLLDQKRYSEAMELIESKQSAPYISTSREIWNQELGELEKYVQSHIANPHKLY